MVTEGIAVVLMILDTADDTVVDIVEVTVMSLSMVVTEGTAVVLNDIIQAINVSSQLSTVIDIVGNS